MLWGNFVFLYEIWRNEKSTTREPHGHADAGCRVHQVGELWGQNPRQCQYSVSTYLVIRAFVKK